MSITGRDGPTLACRPQLYEPLAEGLRELRAMFRASPPTSYADQDLLVENGLPCRAVYLLRRGWACRVRSLSQGRRSIVDVYLPGDIIGADTVLLHRAPDSVVMLTQGAVQALEASETLPVLLGKPALALALAWSAGEAQRRIERLATAIRRCDGQERIALALVDFYMRLRQRQLLSGLSYNLPLTQRQLGDYVGMTAIHVNRVLRSLREAKAVVVENHVVMLTDLARLARLAGVDVAEAAEPAEPATPRRLAEAWPRERTVPE